MLVRKLKSLPNVKIITSAQTTEVHGDGEKVTGLRYTNRETNIEHSVALAGVFVQIGLIPNSEWLGEPSGNAVKRTRYGEIETNSKGETSVLRRIRRRRCNYRTLQTNYCSYGQWRQCSAWRI